jgi:hypothetical protein
LKTAVLPLNDSPEDKLAEGGVEPPSTGNEPGELPLLHPAHCHIKKTVRKVGFEPTKSELNGVTIRRFRPLSHFLKSPKAILVPALVVQLVEVPHLELLELDHRKKIG